MTKLNIKTFSINFGLLWSFCIVLLGALASKHNWANKMVKTISNVYIGFKITLSGILIGAVWGFVDGVIGGIIIAWIYNRISG